MSHELDRDPIMDRLLAESMKGGQGASQSEACLDAELLAAWTDGTLPDEVRTAAEEHAAECAHCQLLLAAMAQIEAADESTVTHPTSVVEPVRAAGNWWPQLRWLVPAAGLATALAIWVAVPRNGSTVSMGEPSMPTAVNSAVPTTPPPADAPKTSAPTERLAESTSPQARESRQSETRTANRAEQAKAETTMKSADVDAERRAAPALGAFARATPPAPAAMPAAPAPAPPAATPTAARDSVTVTGAAAAVDMQSAARADAAAKQDAQTVTGQPVAGVGTGFGAAGAGRGGRGAAVAVVAVASPDPAVRWRVRLQLFERSSDGGVTWSAVPFSSNSALLTNVTSGVSPSSMVCWLVGRGGTVLVSDGVTLRQVAFPELVVLTGVEATSAQAATVTAADGRRFSTSDGGRSWQ